MNPAKLFLFLFAFVVVVFLRFWGWLEWCTCQSGIRQGEGDREGGEDGGGAETEIQETRASSQTIQMAGDYNTECVRHAVIFTACLPAAANVRLGSAPKLSLYCSPNNKKRQLIDKEDEVVLDEKSSQEKMRDNDKAYVSLSEGVVEPDRPDRLKDLVLK